MLSKTNKLLCLILSLMMILGLIPASVMTSATDDGTTVDVIVAKYDGDLKEWVILYPTDSADTNVTVSGDSPKLLDLMKQLDPAADVSPYEIGEFFGLESDWDSFTDIWWCSVDAAAAYDFNANLISDSKITFYYYDMMETDEPDWNYLLELLPDDTGGGDPQTPTITVDVIVARDSYDGWVILSPDSEAKISVTVTYEGENPTALDVVKAVDSAFGGTLTSNRPNTILGYSRNTNGYGNWSARRSSNGGSSYTNITNFSTATIPDGDIVIIYLPYSDNSTAPAWATLLPLITIPNPARTPQKRLEDLLATELTFDKIKGTNTSIDAVKANLASLPSRLEANAMLQSQFNVSWVSSDTSVVSNSGTVTRPAYGKADAEITMTATVIKGAIYDANKYPPDFTSVTVPITFTVSAITETEYDADRETGKPVVDYCLENLTIDLLTLMGGAAMNPDAVVYDIQLKDPRDVYDASVTPKTTVDYVSAGYWTSSNTDIISVNWMRGKVTRPALGEPDAEVTLTLTVNKGFYRDSKTFTLTIPAVTQAELDAVNAELDAVAAALNFNVIKNANVSAEAVKTSLQMFYRGLGYPGDITWGGNSGETGIEITWATSDSSAAATYGTVTRPTVADKNVTMTATLKSFRLASYVEPRTVEIPIIVRKVSNSANVASITTSPSVGLDFVAGTKIYNLNASAFAESVTITVKTDETGTFIKSGDNSAYGILTITVELPPDSTTSITIQTQALDSTNTDEYTLNISRAPPTDKETSISDILKTISNSFKGTNKDWEAMDMSAYGMVDEVSGKTIVENARDAFIASSYTTDYERIIIALTSLGVNAGNVYAGDQFVADYLDFINKIYGIYQTNEAIFGLLALDSGNYADGYGLSRQTCIDYLLGNKLTPVSGQAAWSLTAAPDIDMTAMAVAALAPYYNSNANVKTAIDGAIAYLSVQQNSSGHYGNSNSTAMVVIALSALGIDSDTDPGFIKNSKSLIDGLLSFKTSDNKFGFLDSSIVNSMSTEQGFRALISYVGFVNANDSYNIYQFGAQTGDGSELTGETNPDNQPPDPNAPKNITVRAEDLYNGNTLIPETKVTLSGTHLDALKAALSANGKNPDTQISESYGYVSSIMGVGAGSTTGWMYALNGEIPSTMLTETKVAEGDELILFYIDWYDSFYFTKFDVKTAGVKTGESLTLTLTGLNPWAAMDGTGTYNPIENATVYIIDSSGNRTSTNVKTGANGKATITFATTGTYTVTAEKAGSINATQLVPPLCKVTVTSAGTTDPINPPNPPSGDSMTVTISIGSWVSGAKYTFTSKSVTVYDVFMKAVNDKGLTQTGAENGYVKSINGLAELDKGPNSGWIYTVNGTSPEMGLKDCVVKNGDVIVWSYTEDYTQTPNIPGVNPPSSGTDNTNNQNNGSGKPDTDKTEDDKTENGKEQSDDTAKVTIEDWVNPFNDVKESDWFYEAIYYAHVNGLMNGVATDEFDPKGSMTRAMIVTILWRYEGSPETNGSNFTDVKDGQWYSDAIAWANENGIVNGYGDGIFGVNDKITREQFAVILYRYAEYKGFDVSKTADLSGFSDADKISDWALTAVKWAVAEGLIKGRTAMSIAPDGTANRAEAATLFMRYIEDFIK